jgi:methylisocitrate lyase|tara:strand:- start:20803 stop:21735 length:933 start_codon:yes stop_codon:yes gene_type:complete
MRPFFQVINDMDKIHSAGARFRAALSQESPLQVIGAINANHALLAQQAGFRAIYLSGGGVAAGSLGMPDLGINTLDDVLTDVRRITDVCDLPLMVDIDTGFGPSAFNIARTVKSLIKFGAAACHLEDQVGAKRCGHRPGKEIVSTQEMVDRIKAAADARTDPDFFIIARTDAIAVHGIPAALERAQACAQAGADAIFVEAACDLDTYRQFTQALPVPVLANITEFGQTPLFSIEELGQAGVGIVLYPLSAFRAMNKAAQTVYTAIRRDGHQRNVVDMMQTREQLYQSIGYHEYESRLDQLFQRQNGTKNT